MENSILFFLYILCLFWFQGHVVRSHAHVNKGCSLLFPLFSWCDLWVCPPILLGSTVPSFENSSNSRWGRLFSQHMLVVSSVPPVVCLELTTPEGLPWTLFFISCLLSEFLLLVSKLAQISNLQDRTKLEIYVRLQAFQSPAWKCFFLGGEEEEECVFWFRYFFQFTEAVKKIVQT